jgi:flagellar basal body rod protein FlgF
LSTEKRKPVSGYDALSQRVHELEKKLPTAAEAYNLEQVLVNIERQKDNLNKAEDRMIEIHTKLNKSITEISDRVETTRLQFGKLEESNVEHEQDYLEFVDWVNTLFLFIAGVFAGKEMLHCYNSLKELFNERKKATKKVRKG